MVTSIYPCAIKGKNSNIVIPPMCLGLQLLSVTAASHPQIIYKKFFITCYYYPTIYYEAKNTLPNEITTGRACVILF